LYILSSFYRFKLLFLLFLSTCLMLTECLRNCTYIIIIVSVVVHGLAMDGAETV